MDPLFRLKVRTLWRFLATQPASFWLINVYLFFEYVRPQSIYPGINVLPWGQTILLLCLAALLLEGKLPTLRTPAGPLLMVFTAVLVVSSLTAWNPAASFAKWELYFSWVLIYLLITNTVTTEKRFFVFILAFVLYSFKMSQHGFRVWAMRGFSFASWGLGGPPGWFHNSGEFGIQMCVLLPIAVEFALALRPHVGKLTRYLLYFIPVTAVASMVGSSSRGALVGGAAVGLWWVARSHHRVRALLAISVLAAVTWFVVPPEQKARFSSAGDDYTSVHRLTMWADGVEIANEHPLFGIGYNNWQGYYLEYYTYGLPHNIFIEAWAELGYSGLLAFVALIAATFVLNRRTRRLLHRADTSTTFMTHMSYGLDGALIGYLGSGFFVTVLYYPFFWINLALTASLYTAARRELRRTKTRSTATARPASSGQAYLSRVSP